MKKSCAYCGKIHPIGYVCPQSIKANQKGSTKEDKFRSSTAWKKKREEIRSRDLCMCRICLSQGDYRRKSISVHHITPLAADYSKRLDNDNLITLCDYHHELAECGELSADRLRSLADTPPPHE